MESSATVLPPAKSFYSWTSVAGLRELESLTGVTLTCNLQHRNIKSGRCEEEARPTSYIQSIEILSESDLLDVVSSTS